MLTETRNISDVLKHCTICPHNCGVDRFSDKLGYCKSNAAFNISSICNHIGEEPIISGRNGIVNIFFAHCNMQCIYCQNYQISNNKRCFINHQYELKDIVEQVARLIENGCNGVGFVSPSHMVPQMKIIINALHDNGLYPTIIYNSNGYDKVETLRELEGLIDIYLPDFKYSDNELAKKYSDTPDYSDVAKKAIKEMFRQKGTTVVIDKEINQAESGLIIRHLVLPGQIKNSIDILRFIAEEFSERVYISLMSQYYPTINVEQYPSLNRSLEAEEYQKVVDEMDALGFVNGWVQELVSSDYYKPNFIKEHPFQ